MKSPEPAVGLQGLNSQLYHGLAGGLGEVADIYLVSPERVGGASVLSKGRELARPRAGKGQGEQRARRQSRSEAGRGHQGGAETEQSAASVRGAS